MWVPVVPVPWPATDDQQAKRNTLKRSAESHQTWSGVQFGTVSALTLFGMLRANAVSPPRDRQRARSFPPLPHPR